MDTSLDVITKRLQGRMTCPSCGNVFNLHYKRPKQEGICDFCKSSLILRKDDSEQFIADRFSLYEQLTTPLINYYEEMGLLKKVDAGVPSEEVMNTIIENLT